LLKGKASALDDVGKRPFGKGLVLGHDHFEDLIGRFLLEGDVAPLLTNLDKAAALKGARGSLARNAGKLWPLL